MAKSSEAFRTIREVADWLDVAAHVLRFWESKFPQIKPVKRAGGRRYYRPADMELVGGIKVLLHDRGQTIRGVQKMIRENGVAAVSALSPPIDLEDGEVIDIDAIGDWIDEAEAERETQAVDGAEAWDEDGDTPPQPRFPFMVATPEPELATEQEPAADAAPDPGAGPEPDPAPAPPAIRLVPDPAAQEDVPPDAGTDTDTVAHAAPDTDPDAAPLDRLAGLAERAERLPPAAIARLRPALVALRDRMRADPPGPAA